MSVEHYYYISSRPKRFDLNLREVWQYRDLVLLLTKKTFVLTYKQTILGPAWIVLNPLLSSLIYTVVFGHIAGIGTDGVPKLLFYLCSNAVWSLFAYCVNNNAHTFTANARVFGKVYFPRLTVPISHMLVGLMKFGIQMIFVFALLLWYVARGAVHPVWFAWLLLPLVLFHLSLLGMSVGIVISSLTTKYRDLAILVSFGLQLWMYATPVVYPLSQLGEGWIRSAMLLNPVTAPVELFRYVLFGQGTVLPLNCLYSAAVTAVCAVLGIMIFNRVEKNFMDTV